MLVNKKMGWKREVEKERLIISAEHVPSDNEFWRLTRAEWALGLIAYAAYMEIKCEAASNAHSDACMERDMGEVELERLHIERKEK